MIKPVAMLPECPSVPAQDWEQQPVLCSLEEVDTGSEIVKTVIKCSRCGWIDFTSLDRWAEDWYKGRLDKATQRTAMAMTGEPFTFHRGPDEDITVQEALGQALGAASVCWDNLEGAGEFNSTRAAQILKALWAFLQEKGVPTSPR